MDNDNIEKEVKDLLESASENSGVCYIHAEMKDGNLKLASAGSGFALLYTVMCCLDAIAERSGVPYNRVMRHLNSMHKQHEMIQAKEQYVNDKEDKKWLQ